MHCSPNTKNKTTSNCCITSGKRPLPSVLSFSSRLAGWKRWSVSCKSPYRLTRSWNDSIVKLSKRTPTNPSNENQLINGSFTPFGTVNRNLQFRREVTGLTPAGTLTSTRRPPGSSTVRLVPR